MTANQPELFGGENLQSAPRTQGVRESSPRWLGLDINHRRLFEALQDGWLRPDEKKAGWLLGVQAYVAALPDASMTSSKHAIRTLIELDIERLPRVGVLIHPGSDWVDAALDDEVAGSTPLFWPGSLPTFAICKLTVGTQEERARLLGLASQISNIQLPDQLVTVDAACSESLNRVEPPSDAVQRLVVPPEEDAMRGAMSMAIWAVPRVNPWLDLLVASLSGDIEEQEMKAIEVDADWWGFAPWDRRKSGTARTDLQTTLWLAAIEVFAGAAETKDIIAGDLAERIADVALRSGADPKEIKRWKLSTQEILFGEATISLEHSKRGWRSSPVGSAIQLVLSRPDPARFITWCKDMPDMPPAVWWSAAALCGLVHGYRRLDVRFRGSAEQREMLAVRALQMCNGNAEKVRWLNDDGKPKWRSQAGGEPSFSLYWGNQLIANMPMQARGAWYNAELGDGNVLRAAKSVAETLGWRECWYEELQIPPGELTIQSAGKVRILGDRIDVQDQPLRVRIPPDASRRSCFDKQVFRRHVATEKGLLSPPPRFPGVERMDGNPRADL